MSVDTGDDAVEAELAHVKAGTNNYDFKIARHCRICQDPTFLRLVNNMLANGMTYAFILRTVEPLAQAYDQKINYAAIYTHARKHFPLKQSANAMYREIIEQRANEAGIDWVNGLASALTPIAFFEIVMSQSMEQITSGRAEITPDTGLRAAEKLHAILADREDNAEVERIVMQFNQLVEAVKKHVPEQFWRHVLAEINGENIQDAEVVPVPEVEQ